MASSPVKVGLHIPAASTGQLPSGAEYIEFFKQAEALGYDSLWTEDRVFHDANFLEPLTLLSWAAASTEHIQLGTAVLLLALRNAPALARQVSTMDHLSGGRLNLGISIGGRPNEFPGLGLRESKRVANLRESIAVLKQLLPRKVVVDEGQSEEPAAHGAERKGHEEQDEDLESVNDQALAAVAGVVHRRSVSRLIGMPFKGGGHFRGTASRVGAEPMSC